jgi:hypothetical protein
MRMKSIGLIFLGTVVGAVLTLHGQDAAPPSVDLYSGQKQPDITATATSSSEPIAPDLPELSELDEAFKQKSLGKELDKRRLHIEWRQLKNQVANDPSVRAAAAAISTAHTDLEKRERLREYYNVYYGRMSALASSAEIKVALQSLRDAHVGSTAQPRVRPSTDSSLPSPTPSPTTGHKQKKTRKHRTP